MFSLLIKELDFIFLFVGTAAGAVLCGGPKKYPHTSSRTWTIQTLDDSDLVNSDFIFSSDHFTGQFGPCEICLSLN